MMKDKYTKYLLINYNGNVNNIYGTVAHTRRPSVRVYCLRHVLMRIRYRYVYPEHNA